MYKILRIVWEKQPLRYRLRCLYLNTNIIHSFPVHKQYRKYSSVLLAVYNPSVIEQEKVRCRPLFERE